MTILGLYAFGDKIYDKIFSVEFSQVSVSEEKMLEVPKDKKIVLEDL